MGYSQRRHRPRPAQPEAMNDPRPNENRQDDNELTAEELRAERLRFCKWCLMTAGALAADRSTKFLPVVVAQAFFIGNIAIAMIRTKAIAQEVNPSTYINIEMHSIAFSALFFWLISAVIMSSIIGASQTAEALPRILDRFSKDLSKARFPLDLPKKSKDDLLSKERVWRGWHLLLAAGGLHVPSLPSRTKSSRSSRTE